MTKNFLLTINERSLEYYRDIINYLKGLAGFNYLLVTEHIGQQNKHYHAYVQYEQNKHLSTRRLHGAHIEKCFGSPQQNIAYCKCEDQKHIAEGITAVIIEEEGEPRLTGNQLSVKELKEINDADDLPDYRYYRTWKSLKEDDECDLDVDELEKSVKVYWIQGPSGIGKTQKAKDIVRDHKETLGSKVNFIKYENGFYLGAGGKAKVAIYDDFRDSHMKPSEFINLIDYNKHFMNIKNGRKLNNYNLIIFTSVQKLDRIYRKMNDDEPKKQWERRIEVINMFPPEQVHIGGYPVGYRTDFNELEEYEVTDHWDGTRIVLN